jgi:phospholipid/cholesterol/gamma-HCH transport system substrate-binding protein
MNRKRLAAGTAAVLALLLACSAVFVVRQAFFRPKTITAVFTTARAIYSGDDVRVSGVTVGKITAISATGTHVTITMTVDHSVSIPADAKAVIVAQNVVAARYMQLAPAYEGGPVMPDGAVIPVERTAVPVEWDEVKTQLMRLATDLGPHGQTSSSSVGRFIDSAADSLAGNGDKLRQTLAQLSGVGRILAGGSSNIVDIITNLQTFVAALRDSKTQIVQFQDRLAALSSVLDNSTSDLDAALTNLSQAVGEVQRFIANTRDKTSEQIQRLANVTQNLVDHRRDLEQVLHVAPNAGANAYSFYDPNTGTLNGSFVINDFSNPVQFLCAGLGAIENVTAAETGKLCAQYLGPALKTLSLNNLPLPFNFLLQKSASPGNVIYTDPALAPGGPGAAPGPPDIWPAVSAYAGLPGDTPPPPGSPPAASGLTNTGSAAVPAQGAPPADSVYGQPGQPMWVPSESLTGQPPTIPAPTPMDAPDVLLPAERPPR